LVKCSFLFQNGFLKGVFRTISEVDVAASHQLRNHFAVGFSNPARSYAPNGELTAGQPCDSP
jgi:hypothetical protein